MTYNDQIHRIRTVVLIIQKVKTIPGAMQQFNIERVFSRAEPDPQYGK